MASVLVGLFDTREAAERARTELTQAGFEPDEVTSQPDGSTGGGTSTMSSGSAGTSSATTHEGPVARFFHSIFGGDDVDDDDDRHRQSYGEAFRRGAYGFTVTTDDDASIDRAEAIMNRCGAIDIDERSSQWQGEGWSGAPTTGMTTGSAATSGVAMAGMTGTAATSGAGMSGIGMGGTSGATGTSVDTGQTQTLQEVEERLAVGKRVVARGGVRVFTRVREIPVDESVTLREEHASIERRTVDRPATEADFQAFKEGTIEVRETAEEAVVAKTARVVGEVEVGKVATEREEAIHDTVRRTEVEVEPIVGESGASGERTRDSLGRDSSTSDPMERASMER